MKPTAGSLQSEIHQLIDFLEQHSFFSLKVEELHALREEAKGLAEKMASIERGFLTVGLLGGTGVGKSTLMNALAGSEIASTSHRRPHTDHVLIYRYVAANVLPALALTDVPWREVTHRSDAIRQILLCDLPDFDSLMGEHREHVLHFLEHLDVLVWVTSPEKYADGRFYEFLHMVPKAGQNFYFVLNKMDLLFENEALEKGYEKLHVVSRSLQAHIKENGIEEPVLYTLSAQEASDSGHIVTWNQFPAFKQQIFQQRDVKTITAIKAANLDVEFHQLLRAFQKEVVNLEIFGRILETSLKELQQHRSSWVQAGQEAIDPWLSEHIRPHILACQGKPSLLLGPGYGLAVLIQEFLERFRGEKRTTRDFSNSVIPEEIAVPFLRRLEWVDDRLNQRILHQNLPSSFSEQLGEVLDVSRRFEEMKERFLGVVMFHPAESLLPSFLGFQVFQFLTYFFILAFFLLAIGGETVWGDLLNDPGVSSGLRLLLSCIHTLFSTGGLAALGSYALLNLFFAFRFYRGYRRRLHFLSQKILGILSGELMKIWEKELDSLSVDLSALRADVQSQVSTIHALKEERERY
jgi:GTP-binding protein EngB required for normal cell division